MYKFYLLHFPYKLRYFALCEILKWTDIIRWIILMNIPITIIIISLEFFTSALANGISLEPPQVSRTLLSNLAVLNNVVVWMVSTRQPTSKSSNPFSYYSKRTNYNWYNCHLHVP